MPAWMPLTTTGCLQLQHVQLQTLPADDCSFEITDPPARYFEQPFLVILSIAVFFFTF